MTVFSMHQSETEEQTEGMVNIELSGSDKLGYRKSDFLFPCDRNDGLVSPVRVLWLREFHLPRSPKQSTP